MKKTKIEWCDSTWNPVTGCLHGCEYCYARAMAKRFPAVYPNGFEPMFYKDRLNQFDNCKGRNIFVCSMGDLFGDFIPDEWIEKVLDKCEQNQQHNYLFLTKNPERYWDILMGFRLPYQKTLGLEQQLQEKPESLKICRELKQLTPLYRLNPYLMTFLIQSLKECQSG